MQQTDVALGCHVRETIGGAQPDVDVGPRALHGVEKQH